jgi:hypothetical protein
MKKTSGGKLPKYSYTGKGEGVTGWKNYYVVEIRNL